VQNFNTEAFSDILHYWNFSVSQSVSHHHLLPLSHIFCCWLFIA